MAETTHLNMEQAAALNYRPDCATCRSRAYDECANCGDPLCDECCIRCAGCDDFKDSPWCIKCAISRGAFEKRGDARFCGNCPLPESVLDARECL